MITIRRAVLALAALALALSACAAPEKGEVYARYFYPAYDWVQMVCSAYNKNGGCAVNIPVIQHEPDRWQLGLRDGDDEGSRDVTQREYERCHNGDQYPGCGR
jgi:ABC-type glycerol-3-phosphate transport system substrate-binding protein